MQTPVRETRVKCASAVKVGDEILVISGESRQFAYVETVTKVQRTNGQVLIDTLVSFDGKTMKNCVDLKADDDVYLL